MNAQSDALAALVRALAGRPWFVFGAQALRVWGAPRQTLDIDVTVAVDVSEVPTLITALRACGLEPKASDPVAFAARYHVIPLLHASGTPVDLILAGTPFEADALARAVDAELHGIRVPVVGPEELVVYKLSSERAHDHEDAASVIRRQGPRLDAERVRAALRDAERALEQSDLVREFDAVLAAALRRRPER